VLGWRPEITFEHGVTEMKAHIDHWTDAPVWDPESIAAATRGWFAALAGTGGQS
jgi:UDP-glucose 4-epimerase